MSDTLRGLDDAEAASRGSGLDRVWALWNRRKWLGIVVFLLPFTAATAVIMGLPDLYQSTALVMIERQQVARGVCPAHCHQRAGDPPEHHQPGDPQSVAPRISDLADGALPRPARPE